MPATKGLPVDCLLRLQMRPTPTKKQPECHTFYTLLLCANGLRRNAEAMAQFESSLIRPLAINCESALRDKNCKHSRAFRLTRAFIPVFDVEALFAFGAVG